MSRRQQLEEMLAADPNDVFLHYALALEDLKEGDAERGLARLRSLVQAQPDYVPAYFRQGQVLAEQGQISEARAVLAEGIAAAQRTGDSHAAGEMNGLLDLLPDD